MDLAHNLNFNLDCPICFEIYTLPIHFCENGHSICAPCKENLVLLGNHCPTCQTKVEGNGRNFALEDIVTLLTSKCKYAGCNRRSSIVEDNEFHLHGHGSQKHLEICEYRDVQCWEENCAGKFMAYSEFIPHLLDVHKGISRDFLDDAETIIKYTISLRKERFETPLPANGRIWIPPTIVKLNENGEYLYIKTFFLETNYCESVRYFGPSEKYMNLVCEVSIKDKKTVLCNTQRIPVHHFRKPSQEIRDSATLSMFPMKFIKAICMVRDEKYYEFQVQFRVLNPES